MFEGMLFWADLGLMIYLCWRLIKLQRGQATDLGLFAYKDSDKKP